MTFQSSRGRQNRVYNLHPSQVQRGTLPKHCIHPTNSYPFRESIPCTLIPPPPNVPLRLPSMGIHALITIIGCVIVLIRKYLNIYTQKMTILKRLWDIPKLFKRRFTPK